MSKFYNYSTSDFQKETHISVQDKEGMNYSPPIKNDTPPIKAN